MDLFVFADVRIKGLSSQVSFNDKCGTLLAYHPDCSRWSVRVYAFPAQVVKIKPENLEIDEEHYESTYGSRNSWAAVKESFNFQNQGRCHKAEVMERSYPSLAVINRTCEVAVYQDFPNNNSIRLTFLQLQRMWSKYGEKYTAWFQNLSDEMAILHVAIAKLTTMMQSENELDLSALQVPKPAGIARDDLCLLPELHTRGPCFTGFSKEEMAVELLAARGFPALLCTRVDPACLSADVKHCIALHAAGRLPLCCQPRGLSAGLCRMIQRGRRFFAPTPAAAAMDPRTVPGSIAVIVDPESPAAASCKTKPPGASEAQEGLDSVLRDVAAGVLEPVDCPHMTVYAAALHRIRCMTNMAIHALGEYR
jgi:hypothetical protein